MSGTLLQIEYTHTKTGKEKRNKIPIQYASKTLNKRERKWSIAEKEALALIFCLRVFRPYIALRKFTVRTDHLALTYLQHLENPIATRISRWGLALQEFNCDIVYKPGYTNVFADAGSRNPFEKPVDSDDILEIPTFAISTEKKECETQESEKLSTSIIFAFDIQAHQILDEWCPDLITHLEDLQDFEMFEGFRSSKVVFNDNSGVQ
jgi:hypothetical protein